jgi:hypothetical protein
LKHERFPNQRLKTLNHIGNYENRRCLCATTGYCQVET